MKYILGLTLQDLSYSEKIEESLRIDFLVLINAERDYMRTQDEATFYLVTMNMNVALKVASLIKNYEDKALPDIKLLTPDYTDIQRHLNRIPGHVQDLGGKFVLQNAGKAISKKTMQGFTRAVGRTCLLRNIKRQETDVKEIKETYLHPPGLDWDFFGTAKS